MKHTKFIIKLVSGAALLVVALIAFRSAILSRGVSGDATTQKNAAATGAPSGAAIQLKQLIDNAIDESEAGRARWGVCVISLSSGQVLYSRDADRLFTPASNLKVYTTGVALDLLGDDYQWRTSVYAASEPKQGTIDGDLVLYGRGAPDLTSRSDKGKESSLDQLAQALYQRGVRTIKGNVIGDESYFRANPLGDGWQWNDVQWYFGAEPSALSINDNEVDLQLASAGKVGESPKVEVNERDGIMAIENHMVAPERGNGTKIGVQRGLSDNTIRVWGELPVGSRGFGVRLSVHNPALWAARLFVDSLKKHGITVAGNPQARDARSAESERFAPERASELAFVLSRPLSEVVRATNKESINLNAELILRTLGRERGKTISSPPPVGRERLDDEAGIQVIYLWLAQHGVSTKGLALHDGSGLSRLNLVTPEATVRLLIALSTTGASKTFRESLPLSGHDGTLGGRLKPLRDRVSAKTGSLTYSNSLSGYLTSESGEVFAFSIMSNDQTNEAGSIRAIDRIATLLAAYPNLKGQDLQKTSE